LPHEWLTAYGGIALVVLGGSYFFYAWLRRDKTVRVYKIHGSTEAPSGPRESPQTPSEQQEKGTGTADDAEAQKPSWWRRFFLGE
jgi:hypothetical protein